MNTTEACVAFVRYASGWYWTGADGFQCATQVIDSPAASVYVVNDRANAERLHESANRRRLDREPDSSYDLRQRSPSAVLSIESAKVHDRTGVPHFFPAPMRNHARNISSWRRSFGCVAPVAAAGLLVLAEKAVAQATPQLRGVVRDSSAGVGLSAAEVRFDGTTQRAITDERGVFRLSIGTLPGRLIVRRLGFHPDTIVVRSGTEALQISLRPAAQRLARVVVNATRDRYTGRLAGYYQRLERGTQGQFITRADLDREKPPQLTDMLQRQPGVHLSRGRPGPARLQMRGRECLPLVWLDGVSLSGGDVDLDAFAPTTLEGIEMYLGASVPSRYAGVRGQSECGVILLWSRGPDTEPVHLGRSITPGELEELIASSTIYTAEQVDSVARLDQAHPPAIEYPPSLRAEHIEGTVLAEFVVDTLGRVEGNRFGIVGSTDPLFSDAVRNAIQGASYTPAMRGGRRVRQLVRQPFEFKLPDKGS